VHDGEDERALGASASVGRTSGNDPAGDRAQQQVTPYVRQK
jgi:hypothetical protein